MSSPRGFAIQAMAAAGYTQGEPLFDADFLVCSCSSTHLGLQVPCAPVFKRGSKGRVKFYECAQCGAVGAYRPVDSTGPWPAGYQAQLDRRGRPRVLGETAIGVPIVAPETTDPPLE